MEPGSYYMECLGQPAGEDFTCSDKIKFYLDQSNSYIWDHRHYFTVRVPEYGKVGCDHTQPEGSPGVLEKVMCFLSPSPDCEEHKEEAIKHVEVVPSELVNVTPPPSNESSTKKPPRFNRKEECVALTQELAPFVDMCGLNLPDYAPEVLQA
ncbi:unnamed protein product [Nippostrongylus brasiliensis]|uniref:PRKCSH_1 domain-containing protein n=1 Tax=Nippostrongylus brasiliensis TaxID=27835 RepID=A0A0N4YR46_NIPBR|nr:unnamed protein product [Nippostrongylus brasiliensis]